MPTMQAICDKARIPLNDEDKKRYADSLLLGFLNTALSLTYSARPDFLFGLYGTAVSDLALNDTFPLPAHMAQPLADYATGRAYSIDDEVGNAERGLAYIKAFEASL